MGDRYVKIHCTSSGLLQMTAFYRKHDNAKIIG